MSDIITYLKNNNISFSENINLKTKTWIKRGGVARYWIQPGKLCDFEKLIIFCQQQDIFIEVIGNTSNCYFLNDYSPNLVISTLKLRNIRMEGDVVICDCGFQMSKLARFCNANGFAGYEGFIGLPGTVGGAVVNNSGCYGSLISNVVKEVTILQDGKQKILTNKQLCYENRTSILKKKEIDGVVLSAVFNISKREKPEILESKAAEYQKHRKIFQEHTYLNLGSTFCDLKFRYSFMRKVLNIFCHIFLQLFVKNEQKRHVLLVNFFLLLFPTREFREYVSNYGIQCFTWKDEKADEAFRYYEEFIKKYASYAVMEIEIKKYVNNEKNRNTDIS